MNGRGLRLAGVGFLCLVTAFTTGSSLLLMSALCMLCVLLTGLISCVTALLTMDIRVYCAKSAAERGSTVTLKAETRHLSLLPPGLMEYGFESGEYLPLPSKPFVRSTTEYRMKLAHRGVYPLGGGRLTVTDVFDLFSLSRKVKAGGGALTVYPKGGMEMDVKPAERDTGVMKARLEDDAQEPASVREWKDGDLLRRVHWKLTAKAFEQGGDDFRPIVRTYDEAAKPDVLILPDFSRVQAAPSRRLFIEDAVCECAMSAVKAYLAHTDAVRLITPKGETGPDEAAEALALAEFGGDTPFEMLAGDVMRRSARTGAAVFIKARLTYRDADALIRLRQATLADIILIWVTDNRISEAERLALRLTAGGVHVIKTDGLTL